MSANLQKLCSIIVEDTFGVTVRKVADALMLLGPATLRVIISRSQVSPANVKGALCILVQHNLLTFRSVEDERTKSSSIVYTFETDVVLFIARIPQFLTITEKSLGLESRELVEEVSRAGQITISKLFYILGYKFKKSNPKEDAEALFQKLSTLKTALKKTIEKKYITACPGVVSKPGMEIPLFETTVGEDAETIPKVDLRLLCDKIAKSDTNLDSMPDASSYWKANIDHFQAEFKNDLLIEAVHLRCMGYVEKTVFRALLELGTKYDLYPSVSAPVTALEVHGYLTKTQQPPPTFERVKEQLEILTEDSLNMVTRIDDSSHGTFVVNVKNIYQHLIWATIERAIANKYGFFATRIFRMIRKLNYVEQDKVNEGGMIPSKNCKEITYKLMQDSFVILKEMRKSYNVSAAGHKSTLVFYIDQLQIVHTLVEKCYKSMMNARLRIRIERDRYSRVVSKEERINRILANMMSNECPEVQLKEIRDMITPPERELLNKYNAVVNKLTSGHLHVDHTLFVLQVFLFYASVK